MYVECPECGTVFRVSTAMLTQADGQVRCGECGAVFDGMATLSAFAPQKAEPAGQAEDLQPSLALGEPEPVVAEPASEEPPAQIPEPEPAAPAVQTPTGRPILGTLLWGLLGLALIATLAGQWIYEARNELHAKPATAPFIERYCAVLGCDLPPRRDLERIELVSRNVFSHPNVDNALMITASLVNTAPFAQPYPDVQVSLMDLQGRLVATRRFTPVEYVSGPVMPEGMEPGSPVALKLEIADPGSHALAFEFDFY
jgi:predicted Zn finger-like uncharacterized protein